MSAAKKSKGKSKRRRPGKNGRPPKDTADWVPMFLAAIVEGLHVQDAAKTANVGGSMPYKRRQTDPEFGKAWDEASRIGTRALEDEAARRAFHGTLKPMFHQGIECGKIREYSDTLLMFLLRARKPRKYRDMKHEVSGPNGGEIPLGIGIYLPSNGRDDVNVDHHPAEAKEAVPDDRPATAPA